MIVDEFTLRFKRPYSSTVVIFVWNHYHDLLTFPGHTDGKTRAFFRPEPYMIVISPKRESHTRIPKKIGEIHFCKQRLGVGVITHEVVHAAVHLFAVRNLSFEGEPFPLFVGELARKITLRFYAKNFY